uniref:Uncharacterized protein n=1 Tax=Arundo donax TaxID=35708 RepID=A0A0A9H7B6_ARUDO
MGFRILTCNKGDKESTSKQIKIVRRSLYSFVPTNQVYFCNVICGTTINQMKNQSFFPFSWRWWWGRVENAHLI